MSEIEIKEMTEEDMAEMMLGTEIAAKLSGFPSSDEFYEFKHYAAEGMIKFGGGFSHFLGHALARADTMNSARLIRAFRPESEHHAELYKKWLINREREMTKSNSN